MGRMRILMRPEADRLLVLVTVLTRQADPSKPDVWPEYLPDVAISDGQEIRGIVVPEVFEWIPVNTYRTLAETYDHGHPFDFRAAVAEALAADLAELNCTCPIAVVAHKQDKGEEPGPLLIKEAGTDAEMPRYKEASFVQALWSWTDVLRAALSRHGLANEVLFVLGFMGLNSAEGRDLLVEEKEHVATYTRFLERFFPPMPADHRVSAPTFEENPRESSQGT